jgi:hypothetical protein
MNQKNRKKIKIKLIETLCRDKGFDALQKLANRTKKKTIKKVRQNPN